MEYPDVTQENWKAEVLAYLQKGGSLNDLDNEDLTLFENICYTYGSDERADMIEIMNVKEFTPKNPKKPWGPMRAALMSTFDIENNAEDDEFYEVTGVPFLTAYVEAGGRFDQHLPYHETPLLHLLRMNLVRPYFPTETLRLLIRNKASLRTFDLEGNWHGFFMDAVLERYGNKYYEAFEQIVTVLHEEEMYSDKRTKSKTGSILAEYAMWHQHFTAPFCDQIILGDDFDMAYGAVLVMIRAGASLDTIIPYKDKKIKILDLHKEGRSYLLLAAVATGRDFFKIVEPGKVIDTPINIMLKIAEVQDLNTPRFGGETFMTQFVKNPNLKKDNMSDVMWHARRYLKIFDPFRPNRNGENALFLALERKDKFGGKIAKKMGRMSTYNVEKIVNQRGETPSEVAQKILDGIKKGPAKDKKIMRYYEKLPEILKQTIQ